MTPKKFIDVDVRMELVKILFFRNLRNKIRFSDEGREDPVWGIEWRLHEVMAEGYEG